MYITSRAKYNYNLLILTFLFFKNLLCLVGSEKMEHFVEYT